MRIVDNRRDYYDGVMAHGMDLSLVYIRAPREEFKDTYGLNSCTPLFHTHYTTPFSSRAHIIGFCGIIYPAIEIIPYRVNVGYVDTRPRYHVGKSLIMAPHPNWIYYDIEHIDEFMHANLDERELGAYNTDKSHQYRSANNRKTWERYFEHYDKIKGSYKHLFDDARCPIFVISDDHRINDGKWGATKQGILYNPLLKHFNFGKVKDSFTAFQDVRMWLSNLAMPERPIPEVSNDDLAHSKGHGDKYSFRTPPSKR